jgi:hypothetical protein
MTNDQSVAKSWGRAPAWLGALSGLLIVFVFNMAHNAYIFDISFSLVPMLVAGAACGFALAWSYQQWQSPHSTRSWLRYCGFYAFEMIALGALSLALLRPQFSMAELMVADDSFDRLLPPSMPLIIGAMLVGTILLWLDSGRRWRALGPIALTQVLMVFFLGHQFAFLGLVASNSALMAIFAQFGLITLALGAVYALLVMGSAKLLERRRASA